MTDALPTTDRLLLLAHAGWMRTLARRLVADPHLVEDVVQSSWLAATVNPPQCQQNMRGWLGRVVTNVALQFRRSEHRRVRREHAVATHARAAVAPPAADVVAQAETHPRVVDAVLGLTEP